MPCNEKLNHLVSRFQLADYSIDSGTCVCVHPRIEIDSIATKSITLSVSLLDCCTAPDRRFYDRCEVAEKIEREVSEITIT